MRLKDRVARAGRRRRGVVVNVAMSRKVAKSALFSASRCTTLARARDATRRAPRTRTRLDATRRTRRSKRTMRLTPCEVDKLNVLVAAGQLAQRRLARGLRLNHPEAVALLAMQCVELARDPHFEKDGVRQALTLAEVQDMCETLISRRTACVKR